MDLLSLDVDGSGMLFLVDVGDSMLLEGGGLVLELGDGEYLLIVKVLFVYLCCVLQCGIEGFVIVEFMVIK